MRILAFLATFLAAAAAFAQQPSPIAVSAEPYQLGVHYFAVEPQQPTANPGKVEVIEVFSYACPACGQFQPTADKLVRELPANATFTYLPAELHASWEPYSRAYYAAEALGVRDKTHQALFNALHLDKKPLRTLDELADFYAGHGVDREQFVAAAKSFAVETKLKRARSIVPRYGVSGTPTLIVDGKYRIEGRAAGSYDNMGRIAAYLIQREAAAKAAAAKP
jgi:thiol:disulfide interchange protein DsbA